MATALRRALAKHPERIMLSPPLPLHFAATARGAADGTAASSSLPSYGKAIIVAHGLMGSLYNFSTAATAFTAAQPTLVDGMVALDMRNHGRSPHHPVQSAWANAIDILHFTAAMERIAPVVEEPQYILMGHSMGGSGLMTALAVAADSELRSEFFDAAAAAAGSPEEAERVHLTRTFTETRFHNVVKGAVVVDVCPSGRTPSSFDKIARDLDALLEMPLTKDTDSKFARNFLTPRITDETMRNFLLTNLVWGTRGSDKPASWRCNLPVLRQRLPDIMFPFEEPLATPIATPTLFTLGELSEYNMPEGRSRIPTYFSDVRVREVEGAGHYPHYEKRDAFLRLLTEFVSERIDP